MSSWCYRESYKELLTRIKPTAGLIPHAVVGRHQPIARTPLNASLSGMPGISNTFRQFAQAYMQDGNLKDAIRV